MRDPKTDHMIVQKVIGCRRRFFDTTTGTEVFERDLSSTIEYYIQIGTCPTCNNPLRRCTAPSNKGGLFYGCSTYVRTAPFDNTIVSCMTKMYIPPSQPNQILKEFENYCIYQLKISEHNRKRTIRLIRKLVFGEGYQHKDWSRDMGYFMENEPLTFESDIDSLLRRLKQYHLTRLVKDIRFVKDDGWGGAHQLRKFKKFLEFRKRRRACVRANCQSS